MNHGPAGDADSLPPPLGLPDCTSEYCVWYSQITEQLEPALPKVNVPDCPPDALHPLAELKTYCVPVDPGMGEMHA